VDPNVLVSAAISPFGAPRELLLDWHHAALFQMLVSYDLLYELEAVLTPRDFVQQIEPSGS
jgi:predicted nucleic acid-binding protein